MGPRPGLQPEGWGRQVLVAELVDSLGLNPGSNIDSSLCVHGQVMDLTSPSSVLTMLPAYISQYCLGCATETNPQMPVSGTTKLCSVPMSHTQHRLAGVSVL